MIDCMLRHLAGSDESLQRSVIGCVCQLAREVSSDWLAREVQIQINMDLFSYNFFSPQLLNFVGGIHYGVRIGGSVPIEDMQTPPLPSVLITIR